MLYFFIDAYKRVQSELEKSSRTFCQLFMNFLQTHHELLFYRPLELIFQTSKKVIYFLFLVCYSFGRGSECFFEELRHFFIFESKKLNIHRIEFDFWPYVDTQFG